MDLISQIRHMMAEQKFIEVQKLIEAQLSLSNSEERQILLPLYLECLEAQKRTLPFSLLLEQAESEVSENSFDKIYYYLEKIGPVENRRYFNRIMKLKCLSYEFFGQVDSLHKSISEYLLRQFEFKTPSIADWLNNLIDKYFKDDFSIRLQLLSIYLLLGDRSLIEKKTTELILSCCEKATPRGTRLKLASIASLLKTMSSKAQLEIYLNYCLVYYYGLREKSDYKKIVEMIIYFEDFKLQSLVLDLLHRLELSDEAHEYANAIKQHPQYDFVYFDKYFSYLKGYFHARKETETKPMETFTPDLKLEDKYQSDIFSSDKESAPAEDEQRFLHLLKYQTYEFEQLCDLAVSFLQSDMPRVALRASELAITLSQNDGTFLKASYLKLTSQLQLKDYRAAMDTCFTALSKAESQEDVLSFLYGQAELYLRMGEKKNAKQILLKILAIDDKYRLTRERLDKLDEI